MMQSSIAEHARSAITASECKASLRALATQHAAEGDSSKRMESNEIVPQNASAERAMQDTNRLDAPELTCNSEFVLSSSHFWGSSRTHALY